MTDRDDTTTPVAIGIAIVLAATAIAAALLLAPVDEQRIPADTAPPSTVWQTTNLPPPLTPATAHSTALRGPAIQVSEPPPAPTTTVLTFADDCAEMQWYRAAAGLPERFDGIGYRESRCRNEDQVRTFCCHSWWQLWVSLHLRDHRLIDPYHACGVYSHEDVNSDTPDDKTRAACATKALYDEMGYSPWKATT